MSEEQKPEVFDPAAVAKEPGAIRWMARNRVAANLLMGVLVVGGLVVGATSVKQEVFPEFALDFISVTVPYPGASPEEAESGIVQALEEAVRGLDGVKKLTAGASEGAGSVFLELIEGEDANKILGDVKNAIDRVTSLPKDAEEPIVNLLVSRRRVISLVLYGDVPLKSLKGLAERARDELLALPEITQVEVEGLPPAEIAIEVPQETLRRHGLTLEQIAMQVRAGSLEIPGGGVKTPGGEVLLRTDERADWGREFEKLVMLSASTGARLELGDIAEVRDSFAETDEAAYFNGVPAVKVEVYRVGDETPLEVAAATKKYRDKLMSQLPPSVKVATWMDDSEVYRDRIDLLLKNAFIGLILVLVVLGLFLKPRLAFWVTLGIPISFAGSLLLMPTMDVSINMLSLFAFIITLGMVVDDAIVVGENVFEMRQQGVPYLQAAIAGARQVAVPVTFSILTSVAAFSPMFMVGGIAGKLFRVMPSIVVSVLLISLIESLFVLPAHLSHEGKRPERGILAYVSLAFGVLLFPLKPVGWLFDLLRRGASAALAWSIEHLYRPSLRVALTFRYATIGLAIATFAGAIGLFAGGRIGFNFMPKIESDRVVAQATLPFGSPLESTKDVQARLVAGAYKVLDRFGGPDNSRGIFTTLGKSLPMGGPVTLNIGPTGSHLAAVEVFLVPVVERDFTAAEFTKQWREEIGAIAGLESLGYSYDVGAGGGAPVYVQLSHLDMDVLREAASEVAAALEAYPGVFDIDDGFSLGKPQLDFKVTDAARSLGLTAQQLAMQLRGSFFGVEAIRQQRGRDEVKVMVRLPERERRSEYNIEELIVRTPRGGEMLLEEAATKERGRAYTSISRESGRRVVAVTAELDRARTSPAEVLASLRDEVLPEVLARHDGLSYSFEGEQAEMQRSMKTLMIGFGIAVLVIFALLAIPFRSYLQPLVVMSAIPLGFVGAVAGHLLMGFDLSFISMMGITALSGVVVNDSLVLVDAANRNRRAGMTPIDAIIAAGKRRFRPILLTSLTTFLGLTPMIFETSVQARFMIPMAISLGFGVLFATFIILMVVPSSYLIVEDLRWALGLGEYAKKKRNKDHGGPDEPTEEAVPEDGESEEQAAEQPAAA